MFYVTWTICYIWPNKCCYCNPYSFLCKYFYFTNIILPSFMNSIWNTRYYDFFVKCSRICVLCYWIRWFVSLYRLRHIIVLFHFIICTRYKSPQYLLCNRCLYLYHVLMICQFYVYIILHQWNVIKLWKSVCVSLFSLWLYVITSDLVQRWER